MAIISPSVLAADLGHLAGEIKKVKDADYLHVDVMDGAFVPNITFGRPIIEALNKIDRPPLDIHFMINNPERYIEEYINLGAKIISVHFEGNHHLHRLITSIQELGAKAFVVINPSTPVSSLEEILPFVDGVLVMTVNPGFTGQKFIPEIAEKVSKLNSIRKDKKLSFKIALDGGINLTNAPELVSMGADFLIMGAAVFRATDPEDVIKKIKEL